MTEPTADILYKITSIISFYVIYGLYLNVIFLNRKLVSPRWGTSSASSKQSKTWTSGRRSLLCWRRGLQAVQLSDWSVLQTESQVHSHYSCRGDQLSNHQLNKCFKDCDKGPVKLAWLEAGPSCIAVLWLVTYPYQDHRSIPLVWQELPVSSNSSKYANEGGDMSWLEAGPSGCGALWLVRHQAGSEVNGIVYHYCMGMMEYCLLL